MERKLAAIFSTDVAGYSRLMSEDEEATIRTLTACREVISSLIRHHRGRVVDAPGDNLLAEFASVVDAVSCAVEIQHELKGKNAELPENRRMQFRIGINLGDVIVEGERLYGDGVNIAARLESLAEPGGICISGKVFEEVESKLALTYDYLGEQTVKNIAKPVRVHRIVIDEAGSQKAEDSANQKVKGKEQKSTSGEPKLRSVDHVRGWIVIGLLLIAGVAAVVRYGPFSIDDPQSTIRTQEAKPPSLPLPDRPSIVVLPFINLSKDPEQEYFSDGLTETLTGDLSKISSLFVIARNSAFTYKGKAVKVQDVGREMGVRYVLEGSVQKADQQVRITAQLVDAATGYHLWSERYDRPLKDIFALQDEITQKVVFALKIKLTPEEQERFRRAPTSNLEAYDFFLRGLGYYLHYRKDTNAQARQMFEKAIELDPKYAGAYMGLGATYWLERVLQWSPDPQNLERAFELTQRAIALDDSLSDPHVLLGDLYLAKKQHEQAIAELERAIALDPNNAFAYSDLGNILTFAGRPEEAIGLIEKAIRLDPFYPPIWVWMLGHAYRLAGRYEEAIAAQKRAIARNPDTPVQLAHLELTVIYSELGREEEARAEAMEVLRINPHYSLEVARQISPYKDPAVLERTLAALRKAGLK
jgi:adenylate cyclase